MEFAALKVPGMPCQLVGDGSVCSFLRMLKAAKGQAQEITSVSRPFLDLSGQECEVLKPNGEVAQVYRSHLLPLPTRAPLQGDWALAVAPSLLREPRCGAEGLEGSMSHYNGLRCLCGIAVTTLEAPKVHRKGFDKSRAQPFGCSSSRRTMSRQPWSAWSYDSSWPSPHRLGWPKRPGRRVQPCHQWALWGRM